MHGPAILSSVRVDSPHLLPPPLGVVGPFVPLLLLVCVMALRAGWVRRRRRAVMASGQCRHSTGVQP